MTLLAATLPGRAASYLVTNQPGWNLIANQLDGPNGNNIRVVIQNAPIGSQVRKFNLATKAFGSVELLTAAGGWLPGTNILNPGEGIYFSNASPASFIMTFSGNPHVPALPLNIGPNPVLVARQTNAVASISDILGYNPPNRTVLYQFIPGAGHDPNVFASPNYTIYGLAGGAWITPPGQPTNIHVGESVWISGFATASQSPTPPPPLSRSPLPAPRMPASTSSRSATRSARRPAPAPPSGSVISSHPC